MRRLSHSLAAVLLILCGSVRGGERAQNAAPPESASQRASRHDRVLQRRKGTHIICHRGASEFAHENTLEAYRATFELGGDGNEVDIRRTKDGVLVCFHDDMLDQLLEAFGDVGDYTWEELQRFPFRDPGPFGNDCRIPTLAEVLELHRRYGGLLHLDIKRPELDEAIKKLLDELDMWDHVAYCNMDHGGVLLKDPRLKLCRYKGGLYLDHGEVFPAAIAAVLQMPGDGLIVDDPRGAVLALGRKLGAVSKDPVSVKVAPPHSPISAPEATLLEVLRDRQDWNVIAQTKEEQRRSGLKITTRARAADQLAIQPSGSPDIFKALEDQVRNRSLHKQWEFHGLDGAMSLRALVLLRAPEAVELARFSLWRDDPELEPVVDARFKNPRAWTDFRVKMVIFPILAKLPGEATEKLCRDYLALGDEEAKALGPPLFEEAARTLLTISPKEETAAELMRQRLQVVRGRAILICLQHGAEPWAREALSKHAQHALAYIPAR